jgi:hypothetical protein
MYPACCVRLAAPGSTARLTPLPGFVRGGAAGMAVTGGSMLAEGTQTGERINLPELSRVERVSFRAEIENSVYCRQGGCSGTGTIPRGCLLPEPVP